jgi:hypothetical protein
MVVEEEQVATQEPLLQCTYGFYRRRKFLRLYTDYLALDDEAYELSDLLSVEPACHVFFRHWFAHLALYFRSQEVTVQFIMQPDSVRTLVLYLSHYHDLVRLGTTSTLHTSDDLANLLRSHADEPAYQIDLEPAQHSLEQPFITPPNRFANLLAALPDLPQLPTIPKKTQERFWRYASDPTSPSSTSDQHDSPPTTPMPGAIDAHTTTAGENDPQDGPRAAPIIYNADPAWPWLEEDQQRRARRLKSLQAEREQRLHGFDVEAFAKRLSTEPLQPISVPLRLRPGEQPYYCVDAALCAEPLHVVRYGKQHYFLKDRGKLILTDQRIIYLGHKRQIVVAYNHLLQVVQLPDAMAVFAEYWAKRQYFAMQRPLACVMYLNRILRDYQQTLPADDFHVRTSSDEDDQATIVIDKKKLIHAQHA